MSNAAKTLKRLEKLWKSAKPKKAEFGKFPVKPGKYLVRLGQAILGASKNSGRIQINWKYKVAAGKSKGKTFNSYDGLEDENQLGYLKQKLKLLGQKAPLLFKKLQAVLDKLVDELVYVTVEQNGDFHNVYVDKLADEEDLEDTEDSDEDEEEDEDEDSESDDEDEDEEDDEESEDDEDDEDSDEEDDEENDDEDDEEDDEEEDEDDDEEEVEEDEEDEDEDDDEEEDRPKGKLRKKEVVKKAKKKKKPADDEDEDEDDDF